MNCPVCNTLNVNESAQNCTTCGWYFPMKDTEYFQVELGRAKQQYQMVSGFNQMFQHVQAQSKMLEKISFRLDGLENEVNNIKESKPNIQVSDALKASDAYDYPELEPIQKVEDFDTAEKRAEWWNGLEEQWKKAFMQAVLQKSQYHEPNDKDYLYVLTSPIARFVGPRGVNPSIDFELTNLSGIKHLTNLTLLVASHQALTSLEGIEHLGKLESLFVNSNKLTNIREVYYLAQLIQLYCNSNQIVDLFPIRGLVHLQTLYCCYNQLTSLEGITKQHSEHLKEFVPLPNEKITRKEVDRIEAIGVLCKKG